MTDAGLKINCISVFIPAKFILSLRTMTLTSVPETHDIDNYTSF